jgi:hypothetical protein
MNRFVVIILIGSVLSFLAIFLFAEPSNKTVMCSLAAVLAAGFIWVGFRPRKPN